MARTFDQISREDGVQLWPATAFVERLADELAGPVAAGHDERAGNHAGPL